MPNRVQQRHYRGYRLPPETVSVARPTKWANPWIVRWGIAEAGAASTWHVRHHDTRDVAGPYPDQAAAAKAAANLYRVHLGENPDLATASVLELAGKDLACNCHPDWPCHADILLEVANA